MATGSEIADLPWDVCAEPGLSPGGHRVVCTCDAGPAGHPDGDHVALDAFGDEAGRWPVKPVFPEAPGWLMDAEAAEVTT